MELSLSAPPSIPTSSPTPLKRRVTFAVSRPNLTPAPPSHRPSLSSLKPNHLHRLKLKAMDSQRAAPPRASLAENNGSTLTDTPTPINSGARIGEVKRVTKETNVSVKMNLDGTGMAESSTGIPFLDHMLDALLQALGDRKGINRFGDFSAPLDEALIHVSLDLSGRPHLSYDLQIPTERVGTYDTQLVEHFFQSLVNTSGMTLHIRQLAGRNSHHIIEATFKAFARALRQATESDPRRLGAVPSSKGVLSRS
ncbi:imidazoleglycerol-phosphate dehydratase, chloroplastic-like isoform X3 [Malus sylvestris]|uniref:imidazoleglycerol-phosphate dehydratase, chloroplastic-like isoform X3 n=1 Tax=Malus sylvestris TaxID=3752 RepID=UPI0021AB9D8A|nr:imidazoleglycerol-phosphate dehydratase, chloroplastic-like isoform X3 [Malus sylvestris]